MTVLFFLVAYETMKHLWYEGFVVSSDCDGVICSNA